MDAENTSNVDIVKSVRDMTISRRGGVRTRGGRLPPISLREITQVTSSKKVVAPKIPQRRKKTAEVEIPVEKGCKNEPKVTNLRGRGRGRPPKVIIQTGGSFLAEGPAARTKKDRPESERVSYSRSTRSKAASSNYEPSVMDPEAFKYLLESYDENEELDDVFNEMPPFCLPFLKEKKVPKVPKIKTEPVDYDFKPEALDIEKIKTEPFEYDIDQQETGDSKKGIKCEIEEDEASCLEKKISFKSEEDSKMDVKKNPAEEFQNLKDYGMTMILQFPTHSFSKDAGTSGKRSKESDALEERNESEELSTVLQKLDEGRVGKLQFMKSGKMKLILGPAEYELLDASPSLTCLEAACIRLRKDGGDLTILDKIDRKVAAVPWEKHIIPDEK